MIVALKYSLISGRWIPPAPFFFHKIALATTGLLCFHTNCDFFFFFCSKWEIDGETVETVSDFILRSSKITVDGD